MSSKLIGNIYRKSTKGFLKRLFEINEKKFIPS